ncbi:MAG: nucleotidyltransferase [Fimbriimonadaceae bacterium]|nr:nucleotidyltransferase [Fimbriimonadaceae bacterium]
MPTMIPLTTHFDELLKATQPPSDRIEAAQECHPLVREYLESLDTFETISPHSRLVGSYAQKLSVGDVKDVDILVRVAGDPSKNDPNAKQLLKNLKKALEGLPEYLGYVGTSQFDINGARRSVHVYFKDKDFHLDIVPCIAPDGFDHPIYVPDRGFEKWIESHPLGYIAKLNTLNNAHRKKVKKLAKIFKHYVRYSMVYMRPKSYWLGSMLLNTIDAKGFDDRLSLGELFYWFVDELHKQYDHLLWVNPNATPNIHDPVLGHNVSHSWTRNDFVSFLRHLDEARKRAAKALEASTAEDAVKHWRVLFGDAFPESVEDEAKTLAALFTPGAAVVTGLTAAPRIATAVPVTRFHGDQ